MLATLHTIDRRTLLSGLLASLATPICAVWAQSSGPAVVGFLNMNTREASGHLLTALREGLAELGLKDGTQLVIEERWADNRFERLDALAAELAARRPAVIVAGPSQVVRAVVKAAPTVAIVHATGADPVAAGFAASLGRPGGMVTGLANSMTDVSEKYLEFLLLAVPALRRVGFMTDSTNVARARIAELARQSIERAGIGGSVAEVSAPGEIDAAVARLARDGAQALVLMPSPLFLGERRRILAQAQARRWPVAAPLKEFAEDGALLSYGHDVSLNFRRAAYYVDRILKGARPADLPIEQPLKLELVVNMKTARSLGIALAPAILVRADRVIE